MKVKNISKITSTPKNIETIIVYTLESKGIIENDGEYNIGFNIKKTPEDGYILNGCEVMIFRK